MNSNIAKSSKQEDFRHLFACAVVEGVTLGRAREMLRYSIETLGEAMTYRFKTTNAVDCWIDDYRQSIEYCHRRLQEAN